MMRRRVLLTTFALATLVGAADAGAQKLLENESVIVWNLPSGRPAQPLLAERLPGVLVTLADGAVRLVDDVNAVSAPGPAPTAVVVVALKDHRLPSIAVPAGVAPAFPRDGAARVIESDRVAVWDVRWTTGTKTPMHFHDRDAVAIYLSAGTVRSITARGETSATPRAAGDAVFLARGRTHVEESVAGPRRDVIIELK